MPDLVGEETVGWMEGFKLYVGLCASVNIFSDQSQNPAICKNTALPDTLSWTVVEFEPQFEFVWLL